MFSKQSHKLTPQDSFQWSSTADFMRLFPSTSRPMEHPSTRRVSHTKIIPAIFVSFTTPSEMAFLQHLAWAGRVPRVWSNARMLDSGINATWGWNALPDYVQPDLRSANRDLELKRGIWTPFGNLPGCPNGSECCGALTATGLEARSCANTTAWFVIEYERVGPKHFGGSYFEYSLGSDPWWSASYVSQTALFRNMFGHLGVPRTLEEMAFFSSGLNVPVWIGGYRVNTTHFKWTEGPARTEVIPSRTQPQLGYSKWGNGEPNGVTSGPDCMNLLNAYGSVSAWFWNDEVCSNSYHYYIQYERDTKVFGGSLYQLVANKNETFKDASSLAESRYKNARFSDFGPGHLVVISSNEEMNFLAEWLGSRGLMQVWMGASDADSDGSVTWTSGFETQSILYSSRVSKNRTTFGAVPLDSSAAAISIAGSCFSFLASDKRYRPSSCSLVLPFLVEYELGGVCGAAERAGSCGCPPGYSPSDDRTSCVDDPPVVLAKGDLNFVLECNTTNTFSDPGYLAYDLLDNILSTSRVIFARNRSAIVAAIPPGTDEYEVVYRACDAAPHCGNASRKLSVVDSAPPTLTLRSDGNGRFHPILDACSASYVEPGFECWDKCWGNRTANVTVSPSVIRELPPPGSVIITYSCLDQSGRSANAIRNVTFTDSIAPTLTLAGPVLHIVEAMASLIYQDPGYAAFDLCDGNLTNQVQVDYQTLPQHQLGDFNLVYSVKDHSGNVASAMRKVTVRDTTTPVITLSGDALMYLEADVETFNEPGCAATDLFDGSLPCVRTGAESINASSLQAYNLMYKAVDSSNNAAMVMRSVTARDTLAPNLVLAPPLNATVANISHFSEPGYIASDAHDPHVPMIINASSTAIDALRTEHIWVYIARDSSGNAAMASRRITEDKSLGTTASSTVTSTTRAFTSGVTAARPSTSKPLATTLTTTSTSAGSFTTLATPVSTPTGSSAWRVVVAAAVPVGILGLVLVAVYIRFKRRAAIKPEAASQEEPWDPSTYAVSRSSANTDDPHYMQIVASEERRATLFRSSSWNPAHHAVNQRGISDYSDSKF
eukprot:m.239206 g.239206  ORF g.239206 m.239206 type:complete len:1058 (-) comp54366_c3_seq4:329-3502(-)